MSRTVWVVAFGLFSMQAVIIMAADNVRRDIAVDSAEHKFGVVSQGQLVRRQFKIRNVGNRPVKLMAYLLSCGSCLSVKGIPAEVLPGRSTTVTVDLDTTGKTGVCIQRVMCTTDSTTTPQIALSLLGTVASVWAEPAEIHYGTIMGGEHPSTRVTIVAAGLPDARVVRVKGPGEISISKADDVAELYNDESHVRPIGVYVVKWRGQSSGPSRMMSHISIETNVAEHPVVKVPVHAYVLGRVEPKPRTIFLGMMSGRGTVERQITLRWHGDARVDDPNEVKIEADHSFIRAKLWRIRGKHDRELFLRVSARNVSESIRGMVKGRIVGRKGDKVLFVVPYYGYIAAGSDQPGPASRPVVPAGAVRTEAEKMEAGPGNAVPSR